MKAFVLKVAVVIFSASLMGCYVSYKAGLIGPETEAEPIMPSSKLSTIDLEPVDGTEQVLEPPAQIMPSSKGALITMDDAPTNTPTIIMLQGSKSGIGFLSEEDITGFEKDVKDAILYSPKSGPVFEPPRKVTPSNQPSPRILPGSKSLMLIDPQVPTQNKGKK